MLWLTFAEAQRLRLNVRRPDPVHSQAGVSIPAGPALYLPVGQDLTEKGLQLKGPAPFIFRQYHASRFL